MVGSMNTYVCTKEVDKSDEEDDPDKRYFHSKKIEVVTDPKNNPNVYLCLCYDTDLGSKNNEEIIKVCYGKIKEELGINNVDPYALIVFGIKERKTDNNNLLAREIYVLVKEKGHEYRKKIEKTNYFKKIVENKQGYDYMAIYRYNNGKNDLILNMGLKPEKIMSMLKNCFQKIVF